MRTVERSAPTVPVQATLPGGLWREMTAAQPVRSVALRPVGDDDEILLGEDGEGSMADERATALLARCLDEPGAVEVSRGLTVGDREALLLQLRRITLGETFECLSQCPADHCGGRMELELRVSDLLVPEYADVRREHQLVVDSAGSRFEISFRLPTAADLGSVAALARGSVEQGVQSLLERCILHASRDGVPAGVEALTPAACDAVSVAMAERDPQAEIELDLACPHCGNAFSILFDTATFFLQELDQRAGQLAREVHALAWHYHWSEREIRAMSRRRRDRYLALIADAAARTRPR